MNRYVVDASVAVEYLLRTELGQTAAELLADAELVAPELVDTETFSVLRKIWLRGHIDEEQFRMAVEDLADWPLRRVPHRILLNLAWRFRHNVSGYDAFYVALADAYSFPLLTADGPLARASGLGVVVQNMRLA